MRAARPIGLVLGIVFFLFLAASPARAEDGRGDRVLLGQDGRVQAGETLDGSLIVFGGNVEVQGRVMRDVVAVGGDITIAGSVGGSVLALGGDMELRSTAIVSHDTVAVGGQIRRAPGVTVEGSTKGSTLGRGLSLPSAPDLWARGFEQTGGLFDMLFRFLRAATFAALTLVFALVVTLIFPRTLRTVADMVEDTALPSAAVGLVTFVVLVAITPVLAIIIVGIPALLVLWPVFLGASLFGFSASGWVVGRKLCQALDLKPIADWVTVLFGTAVILTALVPLDMVASCLTPLFGLLAIVPGLGAVVLTRFGTVGRSHSPGRPSSSSTAGQPEPRPLPPAGERATATE